MSTYTQLFGAYLVLFLLMVAYIAYLETGCRGAEAIMTWQGKVCVTHIPVDHFPHYYGSTN